MQPAFSVNFVYEAPDLCFSNVHGSLSTLPATIWLSTQERKFSLSKIEQLVLVLLQTLL